MKKVFEGLNRTKLTVRSSMSLEGGLVFEVTDCPVEISVLGILPNSTGTEIALAVLETMGAPEGSPEGIAAGYLRNALAERQRDQKLEALALELVNAYPNVVWEELTTTGKTWWLQVAAKALELGASVDN